MKTLRTSLVLVTILAAMSASSVRADQPHMKGAVEHLRAARAQLERAEHNKGGWREPALQNVDRAIHDVENGMAAAH
jgi:hypothetical protein